MAQNLKQIKDLISTNFAPLRDAYGVQKMGVFGSFARNEQSDQSDIDILVEFSKPPVSLNS